MVAKYYRLSIIPILLIVVFFVSCSKYRVITVENQVPPPISIPDEIQSLTLMNRSMSEEFTNIQEDTLQKYFYKNAFSMRKFILDSLAADTCLKAIGELLFESERFDVVIPENRNIYRGMKYSMVAPPLESNYVKNICDLYNTDALLVLERFVNLVSTDFSAEMYNMQLSNSDYFYYGSFDIIYNGYFRLYQPKEQSVVKELIVTDTIYWEHGDISQKKLFAQLPSIKAGLINAGIRVALDLDEQLSPAWLTDSRGYFIIDPKNATEMEMLFNQEWDKLSIYWNDFIKSKSKQIKSKAEFNMALASELNGDIETALDWAIKSYKTKYYAQTDEYIKKLKKRLDRLKEISS